MTFFGLKELRQKVNTGLPRGLKLTEEEIDRIISGFVQIKPPEMPKLENNYQLIVLNAAGRQGGASIKPGNITLNWRRLICLLPSGTLTAVGSFTSWWLAVLGALVIWKDLYSTAKVSLEPHHAIAMLQMWENHDGNQKITEEKARVLTNKALSDFDMNQVSEKTFARVITELSEMGCVELSDGKIWLREWVRRGWP